MWLTRDWYFQHWKSSKWGGLYKVKLEYLCLADNTWKWKQKKCVHISRKRTDFWPRSWWLCWEMDKYTSSFFLTGYVGLIVEYLLRVRWGYSAATVTVATMHAGTPTCSSHCNTVLYETYRHENESLGKNLKMHKNGQKCLKNLKISRMGHKKPESGLPEDSHAWT